MAYRATLKCCCRYLWPAGPDGVRRSGGLRGQVRWTIIACCTQSAASGCIHAISPAKGPWRTGILHSSGAVIPWFAGQLHRVGGVERVPEGHRTRIYPGGSGVEALMGQLRQCTAFWAIHGRVATRKLPAAGGCRLAIMTSLAGTQAVGRYSAIQVSESACRTRISQTSRTIIARRTDLLTGPQLARPIVFIAIKPSRHFLWLWRTLRTEHVRVSTS
mmetsp:Transcript_27134/g.38610  ORF Transcript_27134/g.38610 Transcript_27134/m.38610 type:complete len:217 (-) Transcript_27134:1227-1877(-)